MEETDEEFKARWERVKALRAERQARAEQEKKTAAKVSGPFKSRIGRGIAGALTKTADTAESYRAKADYIGNQAGRIKKAVTPAPKPKRAVPKQLRPFQYRPIRQQRGRRSVVRSPPAYRQPVQYQQRDPFVDMIEGPRESRSTSDIFNDLTMGKKKNGKRGDFFSEFLG